ncbi:MAG: FtsQ-type POTRA domain-containing protein, partial [Chloroflexota bacterium]|nr:FtsQ-type POTRA domain-containing protein [Chloroflexota bacterium]
AILLMLLCAAGAYGVVGTAAFAFRHLKVDGEHYTPEAAVTSVLALQQGTNLVRLRTDSLVESLRTIPTVSDAQVSIELPDTVRVRIEEREPILVWKAGENAFLVDRSGLLFARAGDEAAGAIADLRVIHDTRPSTVALFVGAILDPIDLDVATRLGSLKPADLGSAAAELTVTVDDTGGFVITSGTDSRIATFGIYTPTLRPPKIVPEQVRLLRSILVERGEANVARIDLARTSEGTYELKDSR